MEYRLMYIDEAPEWLERAAVWFHQKWGIPLTAYRESMEESLTAEKYPRWLIAVSGERIIGGLGVIENDFHDRKDLFPNVCAVYVEEDCRCRGLAGVLLQSICGSMAAREIKTLYLLTAPVRLPALSERGMDQLAKQAEQAGLSGKMFR